MPSETLGIMVCSLAFALAIGTVIGAVILRAAVALYNKLAGGSISSSVPEPEFGKAMGITFVSSLIQLVVGFVLGLAGAAGAAASQADAKTANIVVQLISFPISLLVMAGLLTAMLPTTFPRALLVTLCYMLVVVFIVAVLVGIVFAVGMGATILGK